MENREPLEKIQHVPSIHNKLGFAVACDKSPKWENHKFSTPKNKVRLAKNPFEPLLHEVMHTNIMSPSVFAVLPNKPSASDDKFCWSIEELATFHPIDIEKSPFVQSDATDHVLEAVAQAKINKFFSAKTILPSPAGSSTMSKPLISTISPLAITPYPVPESPSLSSTNSTSTDECDNDQTSQQKQRKTCATTGTQTYLSLPAVLPTALEQMLKSYMQADGKLMGDLYPVEYSSEEEDESSSSPLKTMQDLSHLSASPSRHKPAVLDRLFNKQLRNNWELSPIGQNDDEDSGGSGTSVERCLMRSRRSVAKLDFSAGHMSVDMSIPPQFCDTGDDLEGFEFHNNSDPSSNTSTSARKPFIYFESPSPPRFSHGALTSPDPRRNTSAPSGNDSSFCRMEDDYVTFHRSRLSTSLLDNLDMDISFSNTPKSRSASATRRRLCDSFASIDDEEDEEEEEDKEQKVDGAKALRDDDDTVESGSPKKYKPDDNLIRRYDELSSLTDIGYNTASTFEESLCFEKNTHLFASTPTKMKPSFYPTNE